ncbi:MAG: undecaprenyl-diphosphatase UppP [Mariniblastus sp.]|nr:undecaprenyl-diphosphatase UppP [Mariniblastus sp.]
MGELIQAVVLGVLQGLTEFLPVSSSGHLEIVKYLFGDQSVGESSMLMTVVLHFATALSTVVVFRAEVLSLLKGLLRLPQGNWRANEELQFCSKIILSMMPAAIVGVLFEEQIEALFGNQLLLVGLMLVVTGVLLMFADRAKETQKSVGFRDAIIIGISQAIAILPGISRSGATISTSVLLGVDREKAARFSFLMVVPLIFGKIAKDIFDAVRLGEPFAAEGLEWSLLVGFTCAFLTGLFACVWMLKIVKSSKLSYFSYYCFIVASLVIIESYFHFFV